MCQWFQDKIELSPNFPNDILFSDEAHFLLSGQVNSKNSIFWGTATPNEVLQRPLHSKKCTAWVAMSKHGIIGWFEDENGEPFTVTKERYVEVLQHYWTALGRRNRGRFKRDWWFETGLLPIQPMWPLSGSINTFPIDWSVDAEIQSGPLIHPTWSHQTSFYRVIWRTVYMRTTLRQSLNWNKQSLRTSEPSPNKNASEWLTTLHAISKSVSSRKVDIWSTFCNVL